MPRHAVGEARTRRASRALAPGLMFVRLVLLAATLALTAYGVYEMYGVLATGGVTALQWAFLGLFGVNFLWISFAGCQAVLGFLDLIRPRWGRAREGPEPAQTAVLAPVYNEDPDRLVAALRLMRDDLAEAAPGRFAFFVLSDTREPDLWVREEAAVRALVGTADVRCPVYYRHRRNNAERKAGNLADWVVHWGGAWEGMLILDADSVMTAATMVTLAQRLAADPGLGLIQTLPTLVRGRTLYARLQQFASQCYGPIFGHGLAVWHGLGSNYWGHNAIIRTRAFAEAAGLPRLAGTPPFGGAVLSHDFVEAALLRRAGWGVRLDGDLVGTHEEPPPSLVDVMVRDRRWCQGNFQHARFVLARGFALTSRLHLVSGIMAYASAALWLLLVIVGLMLGAQAALTRPEYFAEPGLFPTWPVFDAERAIRLFVVSMAVVLAPKLFGWLRVAFSPRHSLAFGGPLLATLSVLLEAVLSALYAPIMMLAQTEIVRQVLARRDSGWNPQRREGGALPFAQACRLHRWHVAIGGLFAALAWQLHTDLFLWLVPVTAGLVLAPLLSWMSGSRTLGGTLATAGILRIPGEVRERALIERLEAALGSQRSTAGVGALVRLRQDAALRAWHLAQLGAAAPTERFDPALALAAAKMRTVSSVAELAAFLAPEEAFALLNDPALVQGLAAMPLDEGAAYPWVALDESSQQR